MVKTGLSVPPPRVPLRAILRAPEGSACPCRPDAVMVAAGAGLEARLDALALLAPLLLLRVGEIDRDLDAILAIALPRIGGVVLGGCRDAGDLVRLGTRLGVAEALLDRPNGSVIVLAEVAPAALLAPLELAAARPRLAGLLWDERSLGLACGAAPETFGSAGPAATVRTLLALAGAALALPVYDGPTGDTGLDAAMAAARQFGFAGKVAAHPGQVMAIQRVFAAAPQPI